MNKDQIKGAVKEVAGKVQLKAGELVGNTAQKAKGIMNEAEGKAQKQVGNVKEVIKDKIDKM